MTLSVKISLAACIACSAAASNAAILTQSATAAIPRDFSMQRLPRFENGFILAYDFDRAVVWSYDRSGKVLMEVPLAIPNSTNIRIRNIAAASDGTVAVTGSASDNEGRIAPVIFWLSPTGTITRVVRTDLFSASQIAFAPDGSLWAAGRVYSFDAGNPAASQFQILGSYDVLRHYSSQGTLIGTALPRTSLNPSIKDPAQDAFLAVGQNRIGFFSVGAKEYVELSTDGQLLGHWNISSPMQTDEVVGIALTPSYGVFASIRVQPNSTAPNQELPVYQFDKPSGALLPAQMSSPAPIHPTALLGSDGDKLVFYAKPPATVSWFIVQ